MFFIISKCTTKLMDKNIYVKSYMYEKLYTGDEPQNYLEEVLKDY